jgi:ADP-ribosylglycohydrolase
MVSTRRVNASYSKKLNPMTAFIQGYWNHYVQTEDTSKSLTIFCHKNTSSFQSTFLKRIGSDVNFGWLVKPSTKSKLMDKFIQYLSKIKGTPIFLFKDTYELMEDYQKKNGKGFGILVNREFICRNGKESDYFLLIGIFYTALAQSKSLPRFLTAYKRAISNLIQKDSHFEEVSKQIHDYVLARKMEEKIVWVDIGFQFTFSLFCWASIEIHGKGKVKQDFQSFTTYPWLQKLFANHYFSEILDASFFAELSGKAAFEKAILGKSAGAMVGFAIGDALGYPIAGIDKRDVSRFVKIPIVGFASNVQHPYFSHLTFGQYTDNTTMLQLSANNLIQNSGFEINSYVQSLKKWGKVILKDEKRQRWVGPTALTAIKKLLQGYPYKTSGSQTTESCSATYRVIPLGLFYPPFSPSSNNLAKYAEQYAMITHNSSISKTGAVLTALIIGDLLIGVPPQVAIEGALRSVQWDKKNKTLFHRIHQALQHSHSWSDKKARTYFGTGSPIYQTLPLALFFVLKYPTSFEKAVLAAANSFRDDTTQEKKRLRGLSWEEQLLAARGGNADGIASLTGAFIGAHLGLKAIPPKLRKVEGFKELRELGLVVIKSANQ